MHDHFHFDVVNAAYIVIVAVVGINLLRLLSAMMIDKGIAGGKTLGSLVS